MAAESAAGVAEEQASLRHPPELFATLDDQGTTRRLGRQTIAFSAALQLVLWLGLAWLLNSPPRPDLAPPFEPANIAWIAPTLPVPPLPPPMVPPRRHAWPLRAIARHRLPLPLLPSPRRLQAPPPLPVVAHRLSLDPPSVVNTPPVAATALPRFLVSLPPQPRSVASVKVGSFAAADPPAVPTAQPRVRLVTGAFATAPSPPAPAAAPSATHLGTFAAAPPSATLLPAVPSSAPSSSPRFGFRPPRAAPPSPRRKAALAAYQPPTILSKPVPVYTALARARRVEGDVVLRVVLTAAGTTRILGVVRGLGSGLDLAAQAAVRAIRFAPARRAGRPVDATVLIRVSFRLAE